MANKLADFIELHADAIVSHAVTFARSMEVGVPLDDEALTDHLPDIVAAIVADLRTPQSRAQEIEKSEGRSHAPPGRPRAAAGTHALFRAHSGYNISQLVAEYRALRASVLRMWADSPGASAGTPDEITRFNEAIDEAIAESVTHFAAEVGRWRHIFLGVLGHDLRSPLSAILMTSELIARMAVDAPVADAAQRLLRSGQRMSKLLDNLLVYNRAEMGVGFELEREDVDLVDACREEVEMLQAAMPDARIHFSVHGSMRGAFDAGLIREALANLVVNAAKYGTQGGEIHVELRDMGDGPDLIVRNAGAAISREALELMFDPLRRGGVSAGPSERVSLGLGLFIVSQIAQAHGGSIRGESTDGTTTFRLHLPRE
ncbi:sensor histidine kinase [Lysobacter sp. 2RAF19]